MAFEDRPDFSRQVADLNKYGQALNQAETVEEVVSMTLEAMSLLFDFPYATFVEVRGDDLRVAHSTYPERSPGEPAGEPARRAYEDGETVTVTGEAASPESDSDVTAALAVPGQVVDDVPAILVTRSTEREEFDEEHVRPLEILASHAVTAISNIRSRERLERARQDLERRKEMVEMYDRLLRHDVRNDIQVMQGYADLLVERLEGEEREHAETISHATDSSLDLIGRIGDLVSTLEEQDEPEPVSLRRALVSAIEDTEPQYSSLTVEYEPADFEYTVYGDDLLESAFANLVSNAAVHNDGDVHVWCYVEEPDPDHVVVGVADDGEGIPTEIKDELFEIGVKGPESEGTGFGLGFVNALVESYGGNLEVGENESGGADFRVTLERVR